MRNNMVTTIACAVVSAFCLTIFASHPQVTTSNAQKFFDNYYRQVTQADRRKVLFQEDLTSDFQNAPSHGWPDYGSWWETQKQVVVDQVESVSGNPLEFNVWLTYYPIYGSPKTGMTSFSLVCNGGWASLVALIPMFGCLVSHLQIQSGFELQQLKASGV